MCFSILNKQEKAEDTASSAFYKFALTSVTFMLISPAPSQNWLGAGAQLRFQYICSTTVSSFVSGS